MKLVWAFITIMAVWTALKFVFLVFKRMGSKNSMNDLIDKMEDGMTKAADKTAGYLKNKKRRSKDKDEQPIVTIR